MADKKDTKKAQGGETKADRRARFEAAIAQGGSVLVGGEVYTDLDQIPDEAFDVPQE